MTFGTMFRKSMRDNRGVALGVGIGMALMGLLIMLIYPSYREELAELQLPTMMEGFLGEAADLASPEGFLTAEYFSWIPLLLIAVAIIGGTAAVVGEEANGTLDLVLAQPVSRSSFLLAKTAALALLLAVATLTGFIGLAIGLASIDMEITWQRLLAASVTMIPLAWLFLGMSLLASASLPTRSAAALLVTGIVVVAYFIQLLGAQASILDDVRKLSPFYWAEGSRVLFSGFQWLRSGVMTALSIAFVLLSLWSFERRDLAPGPREWSLRRSLAGRRGPRPERQPHSLPQRQSR